MTDDLMPFTAEWLREYDRRRQLTRKPCVAVPVAPMSERKARYLARQHGLCCWCGKRIVYDATWEHIIPRSLGGANEGYNLAVAHEPCNRKRSSDMTVQPHPAPIFDFVRRVLAGYGGTIPADDARRVEKVRVRADVVVPMSPLKVRLGEYRGVVADEDFWRQQT